MDKTINLKFKDNSEEIKISSKHAIIRTNTDLSRKSNPWKRNKNIKNQRQIVIIVLPYQSVSFSTTQPTNTRNNLAIITWKIFSQSQQWNDADNSLCMLTNSIFSLQITQIAIEFYLAKHTGNANIEFYCIIKMHKIHQSFMKILTFTDQSELF